MAATKQAETPQPQRGLTFEDVWAALMEDRKQMEQSRLEFDRRMAESRQQMEESRKRMEENNRQMEKNNQQMKENNRQMGFLNNRFGQILEHLVIPGIAEKFNELGFKFETWSECKKYLDPETLKLKAEIDLFLENGDIVIAVEIKSKPNDEDVDDMVERMKIVRLYADKKKDTRKFRGAIASAVTSESVRKYIFKNGFYSIEQSGDTMFINIPKDFQPRDW